MDQRAIRFILAEGDPWVQYITRRRLLHDSSSSLTALREQMLADIRIQQLLDSVENFHERVVSGHKDPSLSVNQLLFLLDLGLDQDIPQIRRAVQAILSHRDADSVYQSRVLVPKQYGGSGEETFGWSLCDAPSLLYALLQAGADVEKQVLPGTRHLAGLWQEQGFPCSVSPQLGNWRGPGRKSDCCPYAQLIMIRLLAALPGQGFEPLVQQAADGLLCLWENSRNRHPFQFYMGTDFRKLKGPPIWYDLLTVALVLGRVPGIAVDARFGQMLDIIASRADDQGRFTPESIYQKCAGWDFGQKKLPSPYLTFLCLRALEARKQQKP